MRVYRSADNPPKLREQLPDGRWQHYCYKCDVPITHERAYLDSRDVARLCPKCHDFYSQPQRLKKSFWE